MAGRGGFKGGPVRSAPSTKDPFAQNPNATKTLTPRPTAPPSLQEAVAKRVGTTPPAPTANPSPVAKGLAPRPANGMPSAVVPNTPAKSAIGRRMKKPVIR